MTVFLLHPVSARKDAVNSVMVWGQRLHRQCISFHSLSERLIFIGHLSFGIRLSTYTITEW